MAIYLQDIPFQARPGQSSWSRSPPAGLSGAFGACSPPSLTQFRIAPPKMQEQQQLEVYKARKIFSNWDSAPTRAFPIAASFPSFLFWGHCTSHILNIYHRRWYYIYIAAMCIQFGDLAQIITGFSLREWVWKCECGPTHNFIIYFN